MPLVRYSVSDEMWNNEVNTFTDITNRILKVHGQYKGTALFSDDGLPQIPITNKQWCQWIHYEHDEQTFWFRPRTKITPLGYLAKYTFGPPTSVTVAKAICWNAAVYIHTFKKPIGTDSVRKAMKQALLDSSCPDKLFDVIAECANRLCHVLLDAVSSETGEINRGALYLLQNDLQERLKRRNCVNKSLRRNICERLVVEGIAAKKTRTEQQNMIRRAVIAEPRLKKEAVRAIERMLSSDPKLLKLNAGVSLLLPYTKREISDIRKCYSVKAEKFKIYDRVELIKDKLRRHVPLTSAERVFKCRHKKLFL